MNAPVIDPAACARWLRRAAQAPAAPWLHQEAAKRMAQRLAVIRQPPAQWLDWWGHAGGGAAEVTAMWPEARRSVLEPTEALAARSRAAAAAPWWSLRRRTPPVWLPDSLPATQADMLWANMVLHQVADPRAELLRWHRALSAQGFVMFTTLGPMTLRPLSALYAALGWPPPFVPFTDMHDLGDLLVHNGFADPVMDQELLQLHWSSPEAALVELRSLGLNLSSARFAGWRTPRWQARLCDALTQHCGQNGRITLPFELVYGHAYKGQPRRAPGEPVVAPIALPQSRRSNPG